MSEGVLYNIEDGAPPPDPAPAAEAPQQDAPVAETPQAAAPEPAREPEVEVDGQRMVPLAALLAERQTAKDLKTKADRLDQIAEEWAALKPYAEFVRANPDLMKPRQQEPVAPVQTAPEDDPELVTLARTLDLYTAEGKPDAKRAAALATFMDKRAGNQAQEAVKPLAAQTVNQQSMENYRDAFGVVLPNGQKADPNIIRSIWQSGDPKVLANKEQAALAIVVGHALAQMQKPQQQAPTQEQVITTPVVTEPSGGRNVNRPAMSDFEEKAIRVRGLDPKKYGEFTKNFKPGQMNALED